MSTHTGTARNVCSPAHESVQARAAALPTLPRVLKLGRSHWPTCSAMSAPSPRWGTRDGPVVARLEDRAAGVVRRVEGLPRPAVLVVDWADPIYNAGHWITELVRLAGGSPVLSRDDEYSVRIPWADQRAADPKVLVIACRGHGARRTRADLPLLEASPGWHQFRAVRGGRVYSGDGSVYFLRPGPRLVDTLEVIASAGHPGVCQNAFPDHDPARVYG